MTIQQVSARMREEWRMNGPYVVIGGILMYAIGLVIGAVGILGILGKLPS
jgi:hypothetical protein